MLFSRVLRAAGLAQCVLAGLCLTISFGVAAADPASPPSTTALQNPGFEAPFTTLPAPTGKAQITGAVAQGWADNSGWADVTIDYGQVTDSVHGGSSAQRMTVREIRSGAAQFVQPVMLAQGHAYSASIWVKGRTGQEVVFSLREAGTPYKSYIDKAVFATDSWRQITISAMAPLTEQAYLMIRLAAPGEVLLDDASFSDMNSQSSQAPPKVGNLLPDSSFEAGFSGGWSTRIRGNGVAWQQAETDFVDSRPAVDNTTAADGNQSMKIDIPAGGSVTIYSPLVPFNFGRVHTASIALKGSVPGMSAHIALAGSTETTSVPLTTSWARYALTTSLAYADGTRLTVDVHTRDAATVWFDAADLEEGVQAQPAFHAANPVELALHVDRPGGVFFDGEPAVIAVNTAGAPAGAQIHATVIDLYGGTHKLPAQSAALASLSIPPSAIHPRGVFKVRAQVFGPGGQPLSAPIEQVFARLPHPRTIAPELSYFGVHIPLNPAYFKIARAIGARWCRVHDASTITKWPTAEPAPGDYHYYDPSVDSARANGMAILGMLDGGPAWESVKPRATNGYFASYNMPDKPDALAQWVDYITHVVGHYKGRIDTYEVWNEPWGKSFFPGTGEQSGEFLKSAYPAAKAADPNVTIVGVDAGLGFDAFTTAVLQTAGTDSYDAFSYHDYNDALYGGPMSESAKDVANYNGLQQKFGTPKPIWVTEGGPGSDIDSMYWPEGQETDTRIQYAQMVRFDVTKMGVGVKHFFFYTLHADPPEGPNPYAALEYDRTIKPIMAARAVLASLVDGAQSLGRSEPVSGVDCYGFRQTDGSRIDVVWSYDGSTHALPVTGKTRALDAIGNPLQTGGTITVGIEPMYLLR